MIALELPAEINEHNQIHLQLPEKIAPQTAKVIILYEEKPPIKKPIVATCTPPRWGFR